MENTGENLDHNSKRRQSIAADMNEGRSGIVAQRPQSDRYGFGRSLIVELVAEHLDTERTPFYFIATAIRPICEADNTLREMCLVHRSWTDAAQRVLRRRICVRSQYAISLILQSPHLGPWVRDLSISTQKDYYYTSESETITNHMDTRRIVCEILRKCPNVVNLHLWDFRPTLHTHSPAIHRLIDVIKRIGDLVFLEHLWLGNVYSCAASDLSELCKMIPRLRVLKSLSLSRWIPIGDDVGGVERPRMLEPADSTTSASRTLEFLSVTQVHGADSFDRLLGLSPQYMPKVLELSCADMWSDPDPLMGEDPAWKGLPSFVYPILPFVTKLVLRDYEDEDDIGSVIAQFPSLRFLRLCLLCDFVPFDPIVLPNSITFVHIHYAFVPSSMRSSSVVIEMLKASSHMRKLLITYESHQEHRENNQVLIALGAIEDYCKANEVMLEMRESETKPSIVEW